MEQHRTAAVSVVLHEWLTLSCTVPSDSWALCAMLATPSLTLATMFLTVSMIAVGCWDRQARVER